MKLPFPLTLFGDGALALTKRVEFKTALQRGNLIQVPKLLRWKFKMENSQVLQVAVHIEGQWSSQENFYGQGWADN